MHGFKKSNVGSKLGKMGMKAVDGGGDPTVMKEAKKKTIGRISGDLVKPRLDKPGRAMGGSVMAPAAAAHPMAPDPVMAPRNRGGKCVGSKMHGDD